MYYYVNHNKEHDEFIYLITQDINAALKEAYDLEYRKSSGTIAIEIYEDDPEQTDNWNCDTIDISRFGDRAKKGFYRDGFYLLQEAYPDSDSTFTATAIKKGDAADAYGCVPVYRVYWDVLPDFNAEDADYGDACDWDIVDRAEPANCLYDLVHEVIV